jgi:hypothetical protein
MSGDEILRADIPEVVPPTDDQLIDHLASCAREVMDAEEANRLAPTLDNTSRLARARRKMEDAIYDADERYLRLHAR